MESRRPYHMIVSGFHLHVLLLFRFISILATEMMLGARSQKQSRSDICGRWSSQHEHCPIEICDTFAAPTAIRCKSLKGIRACRAFPHYLLYISARNTENNINEQKYQQEGKRKRFYTASTAAVWPTAWRMRSDKDPATDQRSSQTQNLP
jgi:hypothetical protein